MKLCKKCCRPVPPTNSAMRLALKMEIRAGTIPASDEAEMIEHNTDCHLFEVKVEDGRPPCTGSQGLRQYLHGQPRDERPGAHYNPELTMIVRVSWRLVQDDVRKAAKEADFADLNDA